MKASNRPQTTFSTSILWQQQQQLKVVAAASLPICWDESLARDERQLRQRGAPAGPSALSTAPHRLETKGGLQSTCIKGIKVHVRLCSCEPKIRPYRPLLCSIMGVMQGLEANQLH